MSFRIHTGSAELQRQLENELAALEGQLDENFDYEITAEVLPREQAMQAAKDLAGQIGAETIYVATGTIPPRLPAAEENRTAADGCATPIQSQNRTGEDPALRAGFFAAQNQPESRTGEGACATQFVSESSSGAAQRAPRI